MNNIVHSFLFLGDDYMFDLLFVLSLFLTCGEFIKEKTEKKPPDNCLTDMEKFKEDVLNGVSSEQRMKNLYNGKYIKREPLQETKKISEKELYEQRKVKLF